MRLPNLLHRLAPIKRIALKLLIGIAALGLPTIHGKSAHAFTPESDIRAQREVLKARVERVRAVLEAEAERATEKKAQSRIAQWYNWGNWPNGWDNYWNDWPNRWWNY